ncbi:hypothetical protein MRX96_056014 [Rhipicephalus microplus]
MWRSSPHLKQLLSPPLRPPEELVFGLSWLMALLTKLKAASTTRGATTHISGVCVGTFTLHVTFLFTLKTTCLGAVFSAMSFLVGFETRTASSSFSRTFTTETAPQRKPAGASAKAGTALHLQPAARILLLPGVVRGCRACKIVAVTHIIVNPVIAGSTIAVAAAGLCRCTIVLTSSAAVR